jgi:hypothetical protein
MANWWVLMMLTVNIVVYWVQSNMVGVWLMVSASLIQIVLMTRDL